MSDSENELDTKRTRGDSFNNIEMESSILFEPYRAIGYITSDTPFYVHKNQDERLLTVSVDHAFHVYNLEKLSLVYISNSIKQSILQMQVHKNFHYTLLSNNTIVKWRRMHIEKTYRAFPTQVLQFLVVSDLLIVLCEDDKLYQVDIATGFVTKTLNLEIKAYDFMHPVSYLNKLFVVGEEGMIIYNIEAEKVIYNFKALTQHIQKVKIVTIEQSPLVDIVAFGLENGKILVVNLKKDKVLMDFEQDSTVRSLSFSTDPSLEKSLLASCTTDGNILFWDMNEGKIHSVVQKAHNSKAIDKIQFLPNEPVLLSSSGDDNSIKMWLFDVDRDNMLNNHGSNIAPRLLKERSGHSDTPSKIKFYGEDGKHIISCSDNTFLRNNSLINEHISRNFQSKKNLSKKKISEHGQDIGKTLDFAFAELRERDWPNIITCHSNLDTPLIWSKENGALSTVRFLTFKLK
jgi:U3 small nucleolar RNA-associated protein 21